MAVAASRRARADSVAKDATIKSLVQHRGRIAYKMAFEQQPHPPGAAAQMPPPSYTAQPLSPQGIAEPESGLKKRKGLKGKIPADLRRSASTPHIRGLALTDASALSPTDKKRNKLGYHRTSVACGHCRRRKIRCLLPSPEDPHGRCANCIRLKKECNFYPVDQSVAIETRPNPQNKEPASGPQSASSQSSPRIPAAQIQSVQSEDQKHISIAPQDFAPGAEQPNFDVQNGTEVPYQSVPFTYTPQPARDWSSGPPQVASPQHQTSPTYWHAPQQAGSFPGTPQNAMQSVGAPPYEISNYAYNQEAQSWVPPTRSMSFGHIEGMPHTYPYQEMPPPAPLSNFHYAPQPQPLTPKAASTSSEQAASSSNPGLHQTQAYPYQKSWGAVPGQSYTSVAEQPHLPNTSTIWYPQPYTSERSDSGHYGRSQPYSSHPG
ncbi:hypothetical protein EJ08DRAFT_385217 [Tothia fuscella]|uniref:Zn(2)-C6 fungal-type domain-containing protein n=1 Tax=Tothia fuscella TaxID=1048955 RepID=A0A9P4NKN3_9PEZI|nr:hypothetical protein EJ08DRAFT_385217 [Tothia fuscella]